MHCVQLKKQYMSPTVNVAEKQSATPAKKTSMHQCKTLKVVCEAG